MLDHAGCAGKALATLLVAVLVVVIAVEQVGETRRLARAASSRFDQPEESAIALGRLLPARQRGAADVNAFLAEAG